MLSACSPGSAASSTATPRPSGAPAHGSSAEVAREAVSPDPSFDYGFKVQITPGGFRPSWLVAGCCEPITWRNLTTETVSVVFDHLQVNSGPIPPGGTYVFTPKNAQSITYHSGVNPAMHAVVQVNQKFE